MISVLTAARDGATIQSRSKAYKGAWNTLKIPSWDFYLWDYRVKPIPRQPLERWIRSYEGIDYDPHDSVSIHVREVLEDN